MKVIMAWLSSIALDGVDHDIPGNGGSECVEFLPLWQRILETALFTPACFYAVYVVWPFLEWKNNNSSDKMDDACQSNDGKQNIENPLTTTLEQYKPKIIKAYSIVFCVELMYKIISQTGIYVLNPCHMCTMLQLMLLSMDKNDPKVKHLFRFQMYVMPGALFALAFPILNTRLLHGEILIYFIQHVFILIVPLYMMFIDGNYIPEGRYNTAWPLFSMSIIVLYHFVFLQPIAYYTSVNLNNILCPAISDPLGNRFYRLAAFMHQSFLVPILSKGYSYYGQMFISSMKGSKIRQIEIIADEVNGGVKEE